MTKQTALKKIQEFLDFGTRLLDDGSYSVDEELLKEARAAFKVIKSYEPI